MMYTTDMVVCLNFRHDLTDELKRQLLDCVSALVPAIQNARAITYYCSTVNAFGHSVCWPVCVTNCLLTCR